MCTPRKVVGKRVDEESRSRESLGKRQEHTEHARVTISSIILVSDCNLHDYLYFVNYGAQHHNFVILDIDPAYNTCTFDEAAHIVNNVGMELKTICLTLTDSETRPYLVIA